MCSIDGTSDKICCLKEEITGVKDKDLGSLSSTPSPQSPTRGLGYLPSPQKGNGLWTHGDTDCGTREQLQPHLSPTLAEKMPGSASCVRLGDRSGLFSWLLFCVHVLGKQHGSGRGRVTIMHFPKREPQLSHHSTILQDVVTVLIKPLKSDKSHPSCLPIPYKL